MLCLYRFPALGALWTPMPFGRFFSEDQSTLFNLYLASLALDVFLELGRIIWQLV